MSAGSPESVPAGGFGAWLTAMRAVLRGDRDADVPCGDCVGCCVSSYPIPLRPGDVQARAEVAEQFLIGPAAPGEKWLMGFREDGSCPFLVEKSCTIYARRPQTCRDYDCRIYAAAGLLPDGERPVIRQRVSAWQFDFATAEERVVAAALRRAADFIRSHSRLFPPAMRAESATAAAVLAVKTVDLFMDATEAPGARESTLQAVRRVMDAARAFDHNGAT